MCSEHGESTNIVHIIQNERVQITGSFVYRRRINCICLNRPNKDELCAV